MNKKILRSKEAVITKAGRLVFDALAAMAPWEERRAARALADVGRSSAKRARGANGRCSTLGSVPRLPGETRVFLRRVVGHRAILVSVVGERPSSRWSTRRVPRSVEQNGSACGKSGLSCAPRPCPGRRGMSRPARARSSSLFLPAPRVHRRHIRLRQRCGGRSDHRRGHRRGRQRTRQNERGWHRERRFGARATRRRCQQRRSLYRLGRSDRVLAVHRQLQQAHLRGERLLRRLVVSDLHGHVPEGAALWMPLTGSPSRS